MKIAIIGTVGVPANYGGFETLVENLAKYHHEKQLSDSMTIYCSSKNYSIKNKTYLSSTLKYIPLNANGPQSILYDTFSLLSALIDRNDSILLLGVSGAIALPLVRLVSSANIVTNIDGLEWRREKWNKPVRYLLRFFEWIAINFSHKVIADNAAIADHVQKIYGIDSVVIAYGGDHAIATESATVNKYSLPERYALSICRIEPENNVHLILDALSRQNRLSLVMVGNWNNSDYGLKLFKRYSIYKNLYLLDPIYDLGQLKSLRSNAFLYIHGHKAGGTNPSLVEAMHFAKPILAFDCDFNRATTEEKALFFSNEDDLIRLIQTIHNQMHDSIAQNLLEVAQRRYTWNSVANEYFSLLSSCVPPKTQ